MQQDAYPSDDPITQPCGRARAIDGSEDQNQQAKDEDVEKRILHSGIAVLSAAALITAFFNRSLTPREVVRIVGNTLGCRLPEKRKKWCKSNQAGDGRQH